MGGMNSGRQPDLWGSRPQVEDALILDIPTLRKFGALTDGAKGTLVWMNNRGELGFQMSGDTLRLDYAVRGQPYRQFIRLVPMRLKLNNNPSRICLLCECGYQGYKLYLSRTKPCFACRKCQNLIYEAQTVHHGGICYLLIQAIKEERRFHAQWQREHQGRGKKQV